MDNTQPADSPATFHNGGRSHFNAWFFDCFDGYANYITQWHKQQAFGGLDKGTIVEIGAGTGANFTHIPEGSRLIAVEPNEAMHDRLRRNAAARNIALTLLPASAECIPLPDGSVDSVIASLVLCTVGDPQRVLKETQRILRPGGTFRFVEHVAARPASLRRRVQHLLAKPWAWLFEGCHTHRDTASELEDAGFGQLQLEHRRFRRSIFYPINTAIWGIATKGAADS
jgi:ubiquinone/menaquinone biosynthesis C-methylase UbiE